MRVSRVLLVYSYRWSDILRSRHTKTYHTKTCYYIVAVTVGVPLAGRRRHWLALDPVL